MAYPSPFPMTSPPKKKRKTVRDEITNSGGLFGRLLERMGETEVALQSPRALDKTVKPKYVPVGLDSSLFTLDKGRLKPEQFIRRNSLDATAPKLQNAIKSGDIFAYNAALSNLRTMISRTKGGPELPQEMPDPMEARRKARLKRRPMGSRSQTLGLSY